MKKWEEPKLSTLSLDSTKGHICHRSGGECPDYTNEFHSRNGHSDPNWNDGHFHTHCCVS